MHLTLRDRQGRIDAFMVFHLVDGQGRLDDHGHWVWIEQLETSEGTHSNHLIRQLIEEGSKCCPSAQYAYWRRRDTTGIQIHSFPRARLVVDARRRDADVALAV